jgi:hypothetical protein
VDGRHAMVLSNVPAVEYHEIHFVACLQAEI